MEILILDKNIVGKKPTTGPINLKQRD